MKICKECGQKVLAKGLCSFHYRRQPHVRARQKASIARKPEYYRERQRAYYLANKESRKEAQRARDKARYAADPSGEKKRNRIRQLRERYGLSWEQFDKMVQDQCGRCAICREPTESLCVDHSHLTGKIRELLCKPCNLALSHLRDVPERAQSAAEYLRRHSG